MSSPPPKPSRPPSRPSIAGEEVERDLVRRVAHGDRLAFEELYRRFARRLGAFLFKMLRHSDLVEEALDDTMLVMWQKAATFQPDARVSTWLFGIAHRKALKAMERSRRHRSALTLTEPLHAEEQAERLADPERTAVRRDQLRQLSRGIEALPPEQRAVVELTFVEGLSYAEIAQVVGCPVNTVKTRMFSARRQLRRVVEPLGEESDGGPHEPC